MRRNGENMISGERPEADKDKKYTVWMVVTILLTVMVLVCIVAITVYIDPFFHYHKPLEGYAYPLNNVQVPGSGDRTFGLREQNDGIVRHFDYDSIICGTSMTENFKASQADAIFDADFVKVPLSGASYRESHDILRWAYGAGKNVRYVIRSIDYSMLFDYYDGHNDQLYMYDNNPFNDQQYVLNKYVLYRVFGVLQYTRAGNQTTDFDAYRSWGAGGTYGAEAVLAAYTSGGGVEFSVALSEDECEAMLDNLRQNVIDLPDEHPETTFYLFFPPYSICYWDELNSKGEIDRMIDAEEAAIAEILKHPNIKLYSFSDNFELVCNLDNYKDQGHYGPWVNAWILEWMGDDVGLLTEDNYEAYISRIREFYNTYDYDSLRQ